MDCEQAKETSGTVDVTFVSLAGASPFIKGGRVKALAVTSAKRASFAPDVPAIAEFAPTAAYDLDNGMGNGFVMGNVGEIGKTLRMRRVERPVSREYLRVLASGPAAFAALTLGYETTTDFVGVGPAATFARVLAIPVNRAAATLRGADADVRDKAIWLATAFSAIEALQEAMQ
jgi:hypothetical protein